MFYFSKLINKFIFYKFINSLWTIQITIISVRAIIIPGYFFLPCTLDQTNSARGSIGNRVKESSGLFILAGNRISVPKTATTELFSLVRLPNIKFLYYTAKCFQPLGKKYQ